VSLSARKKIETLTNLLSTVPFNQVIIFVNQVERAKVLSNWLSEKGFNNICMTKIFLRANVSITMMNLKKTTKELW